MLAAKELINQSKDIFNAANAYTRQEECQKIVEAVYRTNTESSCPHAFYSTELSDIRSYRERAGSKEYRRVTQASGEALRLFVLEHEFVNLLSILPRFKPYFEEENTVFIKNPNTGRWGRLSEDSTLDCAFFTDLFDAFDFLYSFDGTFTEWNNEVVLKKTVNVRYDVVVDQGWIRPPPSVASDRRAAKRRRRNQRPASSPTLFSLF